MVCFCDIYRHAASDTLQDWRACMQIVWSLYRCVVVLVLAVCTVGLLTVTTSAQNAFNSGSTGADGALVFYTPPSSRNCACHGLRYSAAAGGPVWGAASVWRPALMIPGSMTATYLDPAHPWLRHRQRALGSCHGLRYSAAAGGAVWWVRSCTSAASMIPGSMTAPPGPSAPLPPHRQRDRPCHGLRYSAAAGGTVWRSCEFWRQP